MKFNFTLLCLILTVSIFARVHDFKTSRLNSTAGAGVGSVLSTEGGLLNPAPLAIFNYSTLHLQKIDGKTKSLSPNNNFSEEGSSLGVIFTDSKNKFKGALGYFKQEEGEDRRKRFNFSVAQSIGKSSSYGVTYRYTTDTDKENRFQEDKYHQMVIGVSHVISPSLSIGAVLVDPTDTKPLDRKVTLGMQFNVKDILAFIIDIGTDYKEDPSANLSYAGAIQVRVLNDLFLRAGLFNDRKLQEKGNGLGIGWATPKFIVEASSKLTEPLEKITNNVAFKNRQRETSMSVTMRF